MIPLLSSHCLVTVPTFIYMYAVVFVLHDTFQFNAIWHRPSVFVLIFCKRLAGSDVTVTPSVMCMD
jgi:hypothetical protein